MIAERVLQRDDVDGHTLIDQPHHRAVDDRVCVPIEALRAQAGWQLRDRNVVHDHAAEHRLFRREIVWEYVVLVLATTMALFSERHDRCGVTDLLHRRPYT